MAQWAREGKLGDNDQSGGSISAWLFKYRVQLEDDGIMSVERSRAAHPLSVVLACF